MTASPPAGLALCVGRWDLHYSLHNSPDGCDEFTAALAGTKLWGLLTYNRFRGVSVCVSVSVCERGCLSVWERGKERGGSLNRNCAVLWIPTHAYTDAMCTACIHTWEHSLTHTQRWGRQNEVKHRSNKSCGVRLLISSWVHHFKQAETAGEGSAAEQRPSQLGWVMHNGRALHTHTHKYPGPHSWRQPVLSEMSMARAARSVAIRRRCLRGEKGRVWWETLHHVLPTPLLFSPLFYHAAVSLV